MEAKARMNKREQKKFEKLLLAERERLDGSIRTIEESSRSESGREGVGDFSSYAESGTDNFERETALNIASGESEWLNEVSDALKRLHDGTYGVCENCQEPIPKKRLEVFPSARHCVACQEKFERNGLN
jgi:RNA polymerase-binding protein DksA